METVHIVAFCFSEWRNLYLLADGENGFGKYSLLNEFVRGLFSFHLESVQIPRFLKTNK